MNFREYSELLTAISATEDQVRDFVHEHREALGTLAQHVRALENLYRRAAAFDGHTASLTNELLNAATRAQTRATHLEALLGVEVSNG